MANLTFFHNCDNYIEVFNPKADNRPSFYWFNDRFFNHYTQTKLSDKYLYIFVKNPKENNIAFRARHEGYDFHGLYSHYLWSLESRNIQAYAEPSILMSFSVMTPDLVVETDGSESQTGTIVKPSEYSGVRINLLDENNIPIKFTNIPEIVEILPHILDSHPFIAPSVENGKYVYNDWLPMTDHPPGCWL